MGRSEISVPIPTKLFLEVLDFLHSRNSDRDPVDAIHSAIELWIKGTAEEQVIATEIPRDVIEPPTVKKLEGYWWKGIYIPSGSKARMTYKGRTFIGDVTPNGLSLEGKFYSPSEFTWAITNTARNAWRDIEIQFPESPRWVLADDLRKRNQK